MIVQTILTLFVLVGVFGMVATTIVLAVRFFLMYRNMHSYHIID